MDSELVAEVVDRVNSIKNKYLQQRTTFIIISGDADALPAIEKILKSEVRIEVCMWKVDIAYFLNEPECHFR